MAVHIIKISQENGNISADPPMCLVEPRSDGRHSLLVFVFDGSFGSSVFFDENNPEPLTDFPWVDEPGQGIFKKIRKYKGLSGGGIILMEDHHFIGADTAGYWPYKFIVTKNESDASPACKHGFMRSERHPVIINK